MIQFLRGLLRTLIWFAVGLLCAFLFATGFSFTQLTTIATSPNHRGSPNTYTSDGKLTGRFVNKVSQSKVPKNKVPKVIVISLDGATPRLVNQYLTDGVLSQSQGIGLLQSQGVAAQQNITITPSLTAPAHIAIGTGSTAANNDINANSFHLVASPFNQNISGFAAPIGGYEFDIHGPSESVDPTAEPLWLALRENGKKVLAATFPGADGANITVPGLTNSPIVQSASKRTVDYTIPYGTFAGTGARGFSLTAEDFASASQTILDQLQGAGKVSYSPVLETNKSFDTFTVGGVNYNIQAAALDTTNNNQVDYDTLVFFDDTQGIQPGPFSLPSTGPAYVRASDQKSSRFYLEGSSNKAGTAFYVTTLAPDLSTIRFVRYSANYIPRNSAVLADVDDINNNVGFWAPEPDYRITERLSRGLENFSDTELEAVYQDQVRTFVDYQSRVGLRAISKNPDADLTLLYIQQPDGAEHQFFITDSRQATDPSDPNSIGQGQDQEKIARYQSYIQAAYQAADRAVQRVIDAVGTDDQGRPNSNIIVVSDHGFDPFHTAVNINNFLRNQGFDSNKVRAVSSGPAVNIYINLEGREPNGTVSREEYITLQQKVADALKSFVDSNSYYAYGGNVPVFDKIYTRPIPKDLNDSSFGLSTSDFIGQDSGDVFALLTEGYNFDGTQTPVVQRLGDTASSSPVLSVPNFYGAHGYDPILPNMSAIFYAAGPDIQPGQLEQVRNIDIAPTILRLLDVKPARTVQGKAIFK
ncbi:alkaline phosphatase family protein [Mastigocladopsis repens]|uniref:alkaline phosphatase family protein n=1 Tax=Mastigocladopsis repens TaxID=221287 RepID=UPI0002D51D6F|nr:alkaline phosphatase family protein [Mastigocladopsis repens]